MQIVGIQSSPRGKNSNTLKLLEAALEGAAETGAETEIVDVARLKIRFCTACDTCHKTGICPLKDDYPVVQEELLAADGIVWSSPNYMMNVTAQLKTVFDRSPIIMHEQLFEGKYGFSLVTAGSGADEVDFVLGVMNQFMTRGGGNIIGGVGYAAAQGPAAMEAAVRQAREMGTDLVQAIKEKRRYPEQETVHTAMKERFRYLIQANKEDWQHNYDHYVEKGWIKA